MFPVLSPRPLPLQLASQRSMPTLRLAFESSSAANLRRHRPKHTAEAWFLPKSQSPIQAVIAASRRETLERVLQRSDRKALLQKMVEARRPAGWSRSSWFPS